MIFKGVNTTEEDLRNAKIKLFKSEFNNSRHFDTNVPASEVFEFAARQDKDNVIRDLIVSTRQDICNKFKYTELYNPYMLLPQITGLGDVTLRVFGEVTNDGRVLYKCQAPNLKQNLESVWNKFMDTKVHRVNVQNDTTKNVLSNLKVLNIRKDNFGVQIDMAEPFYNMIEALLNVEGIKVENKYMAIRFKKYCGLILKNKAVLTFRLTPATTGIKGDEDRMVVGVYDMRNNEYYTKELKG